MSRIWGGSRIILKRGLEIPKRKMVREASRGGIRMPLKIFDFLMLWNAISCILRAILQQNLITNSDFNFIGNFIIIHCNWRKWFSITVWIHPFESNSVTKQPLILLHDCEWTECHTIIVSNPDLIFKIMKPNVSVSQTFKKQYMTVSMVDGFYLLFSWTIRSTDIK